MNFFKSHINRKTETLYFFSQTFLLAVLLMCTGFVFLSYENITSYINSLRPDKPYQFFTVQYHFYFRIFFSFLGCVFVGLMILLNNKKSQYINLIRLLWSSIILLFKKTKADFLFFYKKEDPRHLYILFTIFIIGVVIRILYLNRPVFHDEAKTFYSFVSRSWIDTLTNYYVPNNHVFHSTLSRLSFLVFGNEEWAFRLPVFFTGSLTLLSCYLYARTFYNKYIAIVLMACITNGLPLVSYSVNARGYILITFFFLLLLLITKKIVESPKNLILYFLIIIVSALGLWTAPVMIMPLIFLCYWYLIEGGFHNLKNRVFNTFIASLLIGFITLLLYSPIILRSGIGALISNKYVAKQNLETILDKLFFHIHQYWGFFTSGYSENMKVFLFLVFFIGIVNHVFNKNTRNLFFSFVFTALTIFFVLKRLPFDRTLLFIYPIFWTYIASGVFSTIKFVSEKVNYSINSFSYVGAIIIFLFTTSICLYNKGIVETYKDQTCVEAEKIITEIKRVLITNDKIETSTPLAGPIRYYLLKNNISEETLHWHSKGKDKSNLLESNRAFIITRNGRNNLESFGYNQTQSIPGFSKPKLWKKYKNTVTVYIIEKYL